MKIISDLIGTLQSYLRIGTIQVKNDTGVVRMRNAADSANVPLTASVIAAIAADGKRSGFSVPEGMSADVDYVMPAADGASGQVLSSDGSKTLSWQTVATAQNTVKEQIETIAFGTSSPVAMFTPPANARILKVVVDVETAFNGTAPTLSVGVAGGTSRYMGATENLLKTVGQYEVTPMYEEDGTPDEVIITYSADSSSEGSALVSVSYANPA
jgi:hypothetical protein